MISYNDRNIPERSLDPPKSTVVGRCYCCGEDVYEGEEVCIDWEDNIIHSDCRDEDSKRFYRSLGQAVEMISLLEYEYGRDKYIK